jgi:hypothetical protein
MVKPGPWPLRSVALGRLKSVGLVSRFVMTAGVSPGIGKSTLTAGLARRAGAFGVDLEVFDLEQIFTRPAFAAIGRAFRDRTYPTAEMLLDGYARLVGELSRTGAVVFDWTCLGIIADLPWAEGRSDILLHYARDVLGLARPLQPVVLNLVGDVEVAVARAAAERGEKWVRRYAHLAAMEATRTRTRLAAITKWIQRQPYEALELNAFREAGGPVWEIDAMRPPDEVLDDAAGRLGIP